MLGQRSRPLTSRNFGRGASDVGTHAVATAQNGINFRAGTLDRYVENRLAFVAKSPRQYSRIAKERQTCHHVNCDWKISNLVRRRPHWGGLFSVAAAWSGSRTDLPTIRPLDPSSCVGLSPGETCPVIVTNLAPRFLRVQNLATTCSSTPAEDHLLWPYFRGVANARVVRIGQQNRLRLYYHKDGRVMVVESTAGMENMDE